MGIVMAEQNGGGGGCLLWFITFIMDLFHNKKVRKFNKMSRGIEAYKNMSADILFPVDSYQENIVISGGESGDRLKLGERVWKNSVAQGRPVVVLHLANGGLENVIARNGFGLVVNKSNRLFDAFTSFELQEICQVVLDTCKAKYDIKPNGRYILEIIHTLLASKRMRPYFSNFANFPIHQLSDRINDARASGGITPSVADHLDRLLAMGQSECAKIDSFFFDMKAQMSHIATDDANRTGGTSVLSAIKKKQLICIDLKASSNTMLVEIIVHSVTIAMNRGFEFSLFLDDVAIANNEPLKNLLCQKSSHNNIICSKDLYALFAGKDDLFTTIVGEAEKTVLFSHGSHVSCEKWAKYIGEYDKIETSANRNGGFSQSSQWGYNSNYGQTETLKREYKVKPEQINRLSSGEAFVCDIPAGSLIQTTPTY